MNYKYLIYYVFSSMKNRLEGNIIVKRTSPIDSEEVFESVCRQITETLPTDLEWIKNAVDSGQTILIANIIKLG